MSIIEVLVPTSGESITEVEISSWLVPEGSFVELGQMICSVDTDKASMDLSAEQAGQIQIIVPEGETVPVGALIAKIDTSKAGEASASPKPQQETQESSQEKTLVTTSVNTVKTVDTSLSPNPSSQAPLSPAARRVLGEAGKSFSGEGTGRGGRVTKPDALSSLQNPSTPSNLKNSSSVVDRSQKPWDREPLEVQRKVKLSSLRKKVSQRLLESQQTTATLTTFNEIDMSALMELRVKYKEAFEKKHGVRLGFMGFFMKAAVRALQEFPEVNAFMDETHCIYNEHCNVGVAVSTEKGLMVPVVRNAETLSIAEMEETIGHYAKKARDRKIAVQDLSGGTFTITNGGVYGSLFATPIINPPQTGILGMHGIKKRPIAVGDQVVIRPMMYVALSYDHRLIDGREAVLFLNSIKTNIEDPGTLFLEL